MKGRKTIGGKWNLECHPVENKMLWLGEGEVTFRYCYTLYYNNFRIHQQLSHPSTIISLFLCRILAILARFHEMTTFLGNLVSTRDQDFAPTRSRRTATRFSSGSALTWISSIQNRGHPARLVWQRVRCDIIQVPIDTKPEEKTQNQSRSGTRRTRSFSECTTNIYAISVAWIY